MIRKTENRTSYNANAISFKSKRILTNTFKNTGELAERRLGNLFRDLSPQLDDLSDGVHIVVKADGTDLIFLGTEKCCSIPFGGLNAEITEALHLQRIDTNLAVASLINGKQQKNLRNLEEIPIDQANKENILAAFKRVADGTKSLLAEIQNKRPVKDYVGMAMEAEKAHKPSRK